MKYYIYSMPIVYIVSFLICLVNPELAFMIIGIFGAIGLGLILD